MHTKSQALWHLSEIIDLERYPIDQLCSARGENLVERCRRSFTDNVCCVLPGFVRPMAVEQVIRDVEAKENNAFRSARARSPYGFYSPSHGGAINSAGAAAHMEPQWREVFYLAYDEFSTESVLHTLYEFPELAEFTAKVLGLESVYTVADRLMAAPISLHYRDCQLGWHCDTQEFTITVMFRPSESGGNFEYVPLVGSGEANFSKVPSVLQGDRKLVREVDISPGDIVLFRGANTLHQVTPTTTSKPRILSVFHLEREAGRVYEDEWKLDVFGRVDNRRILS